VSSHVPFSLVSESSWTQSQTESLESFGMEEVLGLTLYTELSENSNFGFFKPNLTEKKDSILKIVSKKRVKYSLLEFYLMNRPAGAGERSERCQVLLSSPFRILVDFRV